VGCGPKEDPGGGEGETAAAEGGARSERIATMNPVEKEEFCRRLARIIDPDQPPGFAAHQLARAVVSLVQDRGGRDAALLVGPVNELAARFTRPDVADLDDEEDVDR
jgi:hypothetical protein